MTRNHRRCIYHWKSWCTRSKMGGILVAIKIGDLAKTVMKELDDYGVAVGLEVEKVSKEVAEDTAKILLKHPQS